ncbi:MAG: hypothetical protein AAGC60_24675 [Acidobacteriota bacterium]
MTLRLFLALVLAATLPLALGANEASDASTPQVESLETAIDDSQLAPASEAALSDSRAASFPLQALPWTTGPIVQAADKRETFRGCTITVTCPAGHQLSCSGDHSCTAYPNAAKPCAIICDGLGTLCFPSYC